MRKVSEQRSNNADILKGVAAGVIGGIVASFVMDQFQAGWSAVADKLDPDPKKQQSKEEPSTVKAAKAIAENVFDVRLPENKKDLAGSGVHYAMGAGSAAVYGAAAEIYPPVTSGVGLPFGTAVWLIMDEGAVPLLGLSKSPLDYPLSNHVYALTSHFVYGATTELVRRSVRTLLH
jgi:uncharacterized membrane protein YagU involved in acid resistance